MDFWGNVVAELKDGKITEYSIHPSDFELPEQSLDGLIVSSAAQSLTLIQNALGKAQDETSQKARNIITLNAGAAIYVSGLATSLAEGVELAADAIGSGLALTKISDLASFTRVFSA